MLTRTYRYLLIRVPPYPHKYMCEEENTYTLTRRQLFVLLENEEGTSSMGGNGPESSQGKYTAPLGLPSFYPQILALLRPGQIYSHSIQ